MSYLYECFETSCARLWFHYPADINVVIFYNIVTELVIISVLWITLHKRYYFIIISELASGTLRENATLRRPEWSVSSFFFFVCFLFIIVDVLSDSYFVKWMRNYHVLIILWKSKKKKKKNALMFFLPIIFHLSFFFLIFQWLDFAQIMK